MSERKPFEKTKWELIPGATALVVIDPQNDFLDPDGWYAQSGVDISHMRRTIEPTKKLVEEARLRDVPIVWTRHGFHDERDAGVFLRLRPFLKEGGLRINSWGYEIHDEVGARPDDWYVEKNRLSAFYNTNLELILRSLSAETVLFAGVLTNQCVAATSKDANFRDFKPIVVEEATGTTLPHLHDPAIEMISVGWGEVRGLEAALSELQAL
ncbi:cysteine hydrolase family protein [Fodinicurvata fenggangensis]|uniref:cysteine hydrolase family protein n=1 Tax=Fodinicurvata fenggangensis TaxID=1121830 RepID=UPI00138E0DF5|nr:isochorismatase family cysteine hydrolase [Fodinicurvata fenggangensis]